MYNIHTSVKQQVSNAHYCIGMPMYGQSFTLTQASNHGLNAPSTGGA